MPANRVPVLSPAERAKWPGIVTPGTAKRHARWKLPYWNSIVGDSMNQARIFTGTRVLVDPQRPPVNGDMVVVGITYGGASRPRRCRWVQTMIKRLVVTASGQLWAVAESDNPRWGAWRLTDEDLILGVVLKSVFEVDFRNSAGVSTAAGGGAGHV